MIREYIKVAVPINLNELYTYSLPEDIKAEDVIGKRVLVNFRSRKIRGYAVAIGEYSDKYQIKDIIKVIDKRVVFNQEMIDLAKWLSDYYFCGIGEALSIMVPKGIKPKNFSKSSEGNHSIKINKLSSEQQEIFDSIINDIDIGIKNFYLYGVTGSGKTEVYISLIEYILKQNKSVIFLVPEITLSFQTLLRLKERFGDLCAILHSNLTDSVRLGEYLRLFDGKARIAIGPRSALFAPVQNLGLIIIDEENEGAYKSDESPRFHARSVSQYRAKKNDAILLFGSATPSVESYFFANKGIFKLYTLKKRYGGAELPDVEIIDTLKFPVKKNLTIPMIEEINRRLQKKEQVIILQNRRGFSNLIKCSDCENIWKCPRCDISLTFHKTNDRLLCHHCGYAIHYKNQCPVCKSNNLVKIGAGTQRIEDEISGIFGFARIKRIDFDSIKKENHEELFEKIKNGEIDIIVGTQIIAKGLHFPNIKFVGIVDADIMLNIPDFKASERTFALITQVAGRAGREGEKGFVLIQTINPDHYAIKAAEKMAFELFYKEEIKYRKILNFPPFVRMINLVVRGRIIEDVQHDIEKLRESLNCYKDKYNDIEILGPAPCMLQKINKNYRYHILLKAKSMKKMQEFLKKALVSYKTKKKNFLEIDVDPVDLF